MLRHIVFCRPTKQPKQLERLKDGAASAGERVVEEVPRHELRGVVEDELPGDYAVRGGRGGHTEAQDHHREALQQSEGAFVEEGLRMGGEGGTYLDEAVPGVPVEFLALGIGEGKGGMPGADSSFSSSRHRRGSTPAC